MNTWPILFAMLKADFLERTRRTSFLVTVCLVIYLGYAVNTGQVLILLDAYRGIYNSAWVGSLMALVITFFLGIFGFYLVKNTIQRDEQTGVGQIIATTPLTRPQYLLGKWLSNFAVLAALVTILALAALIMQLIHHEDQIQIWALIAPFLFIALPMMALVAAFAVLFEAIPWLKGGFGNLAYFCVFSFLMAAAVQLVDKPWLDVTGVMLTGTSMKAAAKAIFPAYNGSFTLAMIARKPVETFVWTGIHWTLELALQRLAWVVVSIGVTLAGTFFFNRFDPAGRKLPKSKRPAPAVENSLPLAEPAASAAPITTAQLSPLAPAGGFHFNLPRLIWLEFLLLIKGLKWYWIAVMLVFWIGCAASPSEGIRKYWFMLVGIWPVLVWSQMGGRENRYHTEQLIHQAAFPLRRVLAANWLAGVIFTAAAGSGVLLGRLLAADPLGLLPWLLSVAFIPSLALALGTWAGTSKLFEVIYPILWYLGPFNSQSQLASLDYLGIHPEGAIHTAPLWYAGAVALLMVCALLGRRRQMLAL